MEILKDRNGVGVMNETCKKDENELGALWLKQGSRGEYMTGTINGVNVFCTPTKSDNPKAPTWRVMKSKPKIDQPLDQRAPLTDADVPFAWITPLVMPAVGLLGFLLA